MKREDVLKAAPNLSDTELDAIMALHGAGRPRLPHHRELGSIRDGVLPKADKKVGWYICQ